MSPSQIESLFEVMRLLGGCFFAFLGLITLYIAYKMLRIPQKVWRAHIDLKNAVYAVNKGTATEKDRRILKDAQKMGMVNVAFPYVDKDGRFTLRHYVTKHTLDLFFDGRYPTTAEVDAELEVFRVR